jgi:hypothetical protein
MNENTPIVSPLLLLLRSRKFLLAVIGIVLDTVIALHPDLAPMREELLIGVTTIVGVLIGGIAYEDGSEKKAPTTVTTGSAETVNVNQPPADPPPNTFSRN